MPGAPILDPSNHVANLPTDIDTSVLGKPTDVSAKEVIGNLNRDWALEASGIDVDEMAALAEGGPDVRKICGRGGCTYIPKNYNDEIRHHVVSHPHDHDIVTGIRRETNALRRYAEGSNVPKAKESESKAKKSKKKSKEKSKGGARRYRRTKRRTKRRRHTKKTRRKRKRTRRGKK
tara:strand:- start:133 stop:660 length:528 start_codon:yes stop_codon:yes gene_type:complete